MWSNVVVVIGGVGVKVVVVKMWYSVVVVTGGVVVEVWYSVVSPGCEGGIICMIASTFIHCTTKQWQVCTKEKAKKEFGGEGGIIYILIADRASTGR